MESYSTSHRLLSANGIGVQRLLSHVNHAQEHDPAWMQTLVAISRHGAVQFGIVFASLLWTIIRFVKIRFDGRGKALPFKPQGIMAFDFISHCLRAVTLALFLLASRRDNRQLSNAVAAGYIFILGVFRAITRGQNRPMLLTQIHTVTFCALTLAAGADLLPLIIIGTPNRPQPMATAAIVALVCNVVVYGLSPREWLAPEEDIDVLDHGVLEPAREETCSWIDRFATYSRADKFIIKGHKGTLKMDDMETVPWCYNPEALRRRFSDLRRRKRSTGWSLFYLLWDDIAYATFVGTAYPLVDLVGPLALYNLLEYLRSPENAIIQPYVWLIIMLGSRIVSSIFQQEFAGGTRKLAISIKMMLTAEVHQTALSSRELEGNFLDASKAGEPEQAETGSATGMLENLISTDLNTLMELRIFLMALTDIPSVIIAIVGLYAVMGWSSFVGLTIILFGFPMAGYIMSFIQRYEIKLKESQDLRISLASEYLRAIKVIKYFGWEESVIKRISEARAQEQKQIWNIDVCYIIFAESASTFPILALLAMFSLYVGAMKMTLTAATAYTAITLLNMVRNNFMFLSHISMALPKARVALRRFDSFFSAVTPLDTYPDGPARIENATFRRSATADFRLYNVDLDFVENGLNAVTGTSGSGKTTLLLALLGETIHESGKVTRQKDAAFASQTSWLQAKSARDNIIFNNPYDEARYKRVVNACCLEEDFAEFSKGDETETGENGASLSGGQRARIALARALFSHAPLLLLDDIFSALDTKTSVALWNRVFCSDLIKNRTVILVTQLSWIANEADVAITLENGRVKSVDQNLGHVRNPVPSPSNDSGEEDAQTETESATIDAASSTDDAVKLAGEADELTVVDKEVSRSGVLGGIPVFQYMVYFGGPIVAGLTLLSILFAIGSSMLATYFISIWVDHAEREGSADTTSYLLVYMGISFGAMFLEGVAWWAFIRGGWVAAQKLHEMILVSLFGVSLSWYNENPVGRIINRLSGDVESLDQGMIGPTVNTIAIMIKCLLMVGAVTTILPIFLLTTLLFSVIATLVAIFYNKAAMILKQLVSASQSPILTEFSEGMSGMTVIRAAASMPGIFRKSFSKHLYSAAQANLAQIESDQWLKFRTNTLAALINVSAAFLAINQRDKLSAGIVGFALSQATEISTSVLGLVFNINDFNIAMQTFHRVREYCMLPPEEKAVSNDDKTTATYSDHPEWHVPPNWPSCGTVEFRDVTVRYDANGPDILKNINLRFNAGERVAVVGRTGSGKTTLALSILRFTEVVSGQILYDGVDITAIPRKTLRHAISMIPQESQLFQGTLAVNLDPTGNIPEADLEKALDVCQSLAAVKATDPTAGAGEDGSTANANFKERLTLTTQVKAKGENFSHGQRQVLSLCRILARQSKLMLLDEATSSMDAKTDAGIQQALRNAAAEGEGSRCLITIAHRLQTIADYDKVIVMGSGEVLEMGSPEELMEQKGAYYDMVMHDHERKSSDDESLA